MKISICPFNDGTFDIMIKNDDGEEVTFSGEKKLTKEEFEIVNELAPSCVWTEYQLVKRGKYE